MRQPIPASGFTKISGERNPPAGEGVKYYCQFRNGWVDMLAPYPAKGPRWLHTGDDWDIVAVRRA